MRLSLLCGGLIVTFGASCSGPRTGSTNANATKTPVGARWVNLSASTSGFAARTSAESAAAGSVVARVRQGDYLFFKNPDPVRSVELSIDGDFTCAKECATNSGFRVGKEHCESKPIEPGGFVSMCFHNVGKYPVHVKTSDGNSKITELQGILEVEAR
jgi:hypothetical protein